MDSRIRLRDFRDRFILPPDVVYLDGNSLGRCPAKTMNRIAKVVEQEWGQDLIRSWNMHDWIIRLLTWARKSRA